MNSKDLISKLREMDLKGFYVFTRTDLEKLFAHEGAETIESALSRHVRSGYLIRACKGIYVNPNSPRVGSQTLQDIAQALRPGELNYLSLESVLSEASVISQMLMDRITVMTTGAKGEYKTPWGVVEFTHTKRNKVDLLQRTRFEKGMSMRRALVTTAYKDLLRVGRNLHMIDDEELQDEIQREIQEDLVG